jgi:hypothetical protein
MPAPYRFSGIEETGKTFGFWVAQRFSAAMKLPLVLKGRGFSRALNQNKKSNRL